MYKHFNLIVLSIAALLMASYTWAAMDPTRPPSFKAAGTKTTKHTLNSVLVSESRKVAIINGQSVTEGDVVGGAKVLKISKELVRLNRRGQIIELRPKRTSIRREK